MDGLIFLALLVLVIFQFSILILTTIIAVFGIVWAPFASGICVLIAKRRGLSMPRYAIYGGIHTSLLFFPWLFLIQWMRKGRMNVGSVRIAYVLLFFLWASGPLLSFCADMMGFGLVTNIISEISSTRDPFSPNPTLLGEYDILVSVVAVLMCLASFVFSFMFVRQRVFPSSTGAVTSAELTRSSKPLGTGDTAKVPIGNVDPSTLKLQPFALLLTWLLAYVGWIILHLDWS